MNVSTKERTVTTRAPVPETVFRDYPGQWVALREDRVVGVAKDLGALMAQEDVRRDDLTYRVPSSDLSR
jgi:hypothetical protein